MRSFRLLAPALAATAILLAACGNQASPAASDTQAEAVTVTDAWVKATTDGMTGAFGVLTNDGTTDATVVKATSDVAPRVEIHEVVMADGEMVMQPKEGGIVVPAGGSATLEPGGDHIMLMELGQPLEPGDELILTLEMADGSTLDVTAVAKPFTGGNETYSPSGS